MGVMNFRTASQQLEINAPESLQNRTLLVLASRESVIRMVTCKAALVGLRASEAMSVEEAVEAISSGRQSGYPFDFIIMDEEFTSGHQSLPRDLPIVLLVADPSAHPSNQVCLKKPLRLSRLLEAPVAYCPPNPRNRALQASPVPSPAIRPISIPHRPSETPDRSELWSTGHPEVTFPKSRSPEFFIAIFRAESSKSKL